jgi:hypothetical protein
MRRLLTACTLLTLAACGDENGADCAPREESYQVTVAVTMPTATKSTEPGIVAVPRVLASVYEDSSLSCVGGGLASLSWPGAELVSGVPVAIDAEGFTLNVHTTVYPDLGSADPLRLTLLFDENGNGRCDQGELEARALIERVPQSTVIATAWTPSGCPVRL